MSEPVTLDIDRLGAQGHGIAEGRGGPHYVRFALPGERWRLAEGEPPEGLTTSPERQDPICRHFGQCGGCIAQHMSADLYRRWKESIVSQAFASRGIVTEIEPMRAVSAASRRRAVFGVAHKGGNVALGFREEGQHRLVDLAECPVLHPDIVKAFGVFRDIARIGLDDGEGGRLVVTRADNGLDVSLEGGSRELNADARSRLAQIAAGARLVRLAVDGTMVCMTGTPTLLLGGVAVGLPQGAFLQAVAEAEAMMGGIVIEAVGKAKRVADLFCGLGTFTFAMAKRARVLAVDADRRLLAALEKAAKGAQGLKPIVAKPRDLFREPLSRKELEGLDAAVLDPPRAGARAQAEALARSDVQTVVTVSCSPATLARDVRILIDGGYGLERVVPIDQFLYSPHVEVVAVLRRAGRRAR